jgi:molecular chaperone GrpE
VVIRDRRKIDPTGATKGKSSESGKQGRPESSARSGGRQADVPHEARPGRAKDRDAETSPEQTAPAGGVADTGSKAQDDSDAAVRQRGRGEPEEATRVESGEREEAVEADTDAPESDEQTEAAVRESAGLDEETTEDAAEDAIPEAFGAELQALRAELDERTKDLQRVSAEYANYRKRVDRDRGLVAEQATGTVLSALLPVLDDLDRAREHGDLVGPFGAVAEQLTGALTKFGLNAFGEKGDSFDPTRHEAVAHLTSAEVSEPTCIDVMRRGYQLGDRLLRPALVAVADPE